MNTPFKILVVDDEPDVLRFVAYRLKQKGYRVFTATNGQTAVKMAKEKHPDLIFLDIRLPLLDSYGVCRQIKLEQDLNNTAIVFSTADASVKIHEQTRVAGADGYLLKPFEPEQLLEMVEWYEKTSSR